jgi:hypothetical protein
MAVEAHPSFGPTGFIRDIAGVRELVTQYRFMTEVLGLKDNILLLDIQEIWDNPELGRSYTPILIYLRIGFLS